MFRNLGCVEETFAEPIKEMARVLVGDWTGTKTTPIPWLHGASNREIMQSLGCEWGRDTIHQNRWIWHLMRRLEYRKYPYVVISKVDPRASRQ